MSQPLAYGSAALKGALERTSALARQVTLRQIWFEFGWRWLAGAAVFLVLDLLFALSVPLRWVGLLALIAYPAYVALVVRKRAVGNSLSDEHTARLVEEGHPELNNAFINAIQFGKVLDRAEQTQAELMRSEISRAEQAAGTTPLENAVDRSGERKARAFFFWAAGAWIAACVFLPSVVFTILPRMFAPWLDNVTPPFSLTKIELTPKGATVRYGGSLAVQVSVQGPVPDSLTLASQSGRNAPTEAPLESTEPGKYTVTLTDLKQDSWIVATGGGARSGRYLVKVMLPPVVEGLQATYTYAAFTKRPSETEQVGEKGIHGWGGTKVHLLIRGNRELTGGELTLSSGDSPEQRVSLKPDPQSKAAVSGDFEIQASGTFHVALFGSDQQVNSDAAHGKVVMEPDQRPNVWFDEPAQSIVVTPDMKVDLSVGADDEIGISQVGLHRVINGIADNQKALYQGTPVKKTGARVTLDMADLGVRPGDKITYYADAFDSTPGKPNYAETDPYTIEVMSPEAYKKMLQDQRSNEQIAREAKQIQDAIDSLAKRQQELADKMAKLAKALEKKPGDPELKKQMAQAQKEQKALQSEAQEMAKRLQEYAKAPAASKIDAALKQKVGEAAQAMQKAAEQMQGGQSQSPGAAANAAQKAASQLNKTSAQTKKSVGQTMKNMEKAQPLLEDIQRFMSLMDQQGQLVLQARQYEQPGKLDNVDRSRLSSIAQDQAKVQQDLRALQDDFRRHAADAKADFPKAAASAVQIANEIGHRQIPSIMDTAHTDYGQERGPDGFANSKRALEQMEAMVSTCQSGQGTCQGELDIKLSRSLGQSGLGQSMGSGMKPGQGQKDGNGEGSAAGGQMSGANGAMANGQDSNRVAYTTDLRNLPSSPGGGSDGRFHQHGPGEPVEIAPEKLERLGDAQRLPPKASDSSSKGLMPEYRKMIRDYFISVTKEQKP